MPNLGPTELLLLILVLVLLFGAKKLPDTARGIGRSLRIFKAETKGLRSDDDEDSADRRAPDRGTRRDEAPAVREIPPAPVERTPVQIHPASEPERTDR
jgi:sec-independent protein translocase protein TatA